MLRHPVIIGVICVLLILVGIAYGWSVSFPYEYQIKKTFSLNQMLQLNELATELEKSTGFDDFVCWPKTVWVENRQTGLKIELQGAERNKFLALCDGAKIATGWKVENGVFFPLESEEKQGKQFQIGLQRTLRPKDPKCSYQLIKNESGQCYIHIQEDWSIYYVWAPSV